MAPLPFTTFIRTQFTPVPAVESLDLSGRVVIVTGSNVGLGLEAARHFAAMKPARLILAVRTESKGEEAARDIASTTSYKCDVWKLDLGSLASVKAFAERAYRELDRLDILLENAGISTRNWEVTEDGFESTLAANVISTNYLALLMIPLLKKTASLPAIPTSPNFRVHLTLTGSEVHFWAKFTEHTDPKPLAALNDKSRFDAEDRYNVSKLLNLYSVRELANYTGSDINVNVVNPGFCHSSLTRNAGGLVALFLSLMKLTIARTTEVGSRNLVWAATHVTKPGAYVSLCNETEESDFSLTPASDKAQKAFWREFVEIVEKRDPQAMSAVKQ